MNMKMTGSKSNVDVDISLFSERKKKSSVLSIMYMRPKLKKKTKKKVS